MMNVGDGSTRHASVSSGNSGGIGSSGSVLKKASSVQFPNKLQHLTGSLEVKFKGGAFSTWSDVFVRLEGRWLVMYKRERDTTRVAAIELGPAVEVTDINDVESSQKYPRRFDIHCKGGLLPPTEFSFRTKSRKDRDLWVHTIATNIYILDTAGMDPMFGVSDLEHVVLRMKEALTLTPIRIRSSVAVRCATGEEMVAFLVAENLARDRAHANQIGRRLLAMNIIHHVIWEKDFVDSGDHYTIADLDDENNYIVEHFQKYMDSRRFWKYFDDDSENGSQHLARSTASSGGSASMSARTSTATVSAVGSGNEPKVAPVTQAPAPIPANVDKKAKKCSVCGKSFNPLRRRYYCRQCTAVVCSHCSMSRKSEHEHPDGNTRICVSCKLSSMNTQDDFYDRIFSAPSTTASATDLSSSSGRASSFSHISKTGSSSTMDKRTGSGTTLSTNGGRKSSTASSRRESFSASVLNSLADCHLCMNEACAPLRDIHEVPYPVTQDHLDPSSKDRYLAALDLENEYDRLRSVRALSRALQTTNLRQTVSQMCSMASIATSCPVVVAGLLDSDEYIICGQYGVTADTVVARELSLAAHTCRNGSPLVCSDLNVDVRFTGNPWRRDVVNAAFYAGIPLQLSNGHIVGAIEVFDTNPRFACMDVLGQMQTIVKGVMRKFEEIVANAPPEEYLEPSEPVLSDDESEYDMSTLEVTEVQPSQVSPPAPASEGSATAAPASGGAMSQNDMEMRLMELLSQTTTTQEQLKNQQGQMFTAINSHSKQISELAKQLERMESKLVEKLDMKN